MKKGRLKYKVNGTFLMIAVLVGAVLVNLILGAVDARFPLEVDLTEEDLYEFSQQTTDLMRGLDTDITIYAIYSEGSIPTQVEKYLDRYKALSSHVTVTTIDPNKEPTKVQQFERKGDTISNGSLIVECGDKFKIITSSQMTATDLLNQQNLVLESRVTNAVYFVTGSGEQQKIYFTEGHGETEEGQLQSALENEDYLIETINLSISDVPEDADALVVLAPQKDFTEEERDRLAAYMESGGNAAFIFTPGVEKPTRLCAYLAEWGIEPTFDLVVEGDQSKNLMTRLGASPVPELQEHDITTNLISQKLTYVAFQTMSLKVNATNPQYAQVTSLLKTSSDSYGKVNVQSETSTFEEGDVMGPLDLAAIAEKEHDDGTYSRLFVSGSAWAVEYPSILSEATYANGDFTLNAFSWMTEKPSGLSIRPKVLNTATLKMTNTQATTMIVIVVLIPIALVVFGIIVWFRRRYL